MLLLTLFSDLEQDAPFIPPSVYSLYRVTSNINHMKAVKW